MRESRVEAYLTAKVKGLGGEVRKVKWIGRRGAPDRVVMLKGATIWVECKRPGGRAEDHQDREHERMRATGQVVAVLDTFEAIDAFFGPYAAMEWVQFTPMYRAVKAYEATAGLC